MYFDGVTTLEFVDSIANKILYMLLRCDFIVLRYLKMTFFVRWRISKANGIKKAVRYNRGKLYYFIRWRQNSSLSLLRRKLVESAIITFSSLLYHRSKCLLNRAFARWYTRIHELHSLLRNVFYLWNLNASRNRLIKMNVVHYLKRGAYYYNERKKKMLRRSYSIWLNWCKYSSRINTLKYCWNAWVMYRKYRWVRRSTSPKRRSWRAWRRTYLLMQEKMMVSLSDVINVHTFLLLLS